MKMKYPNSSEVIFENGDERHVIELYPDEKTFRQYTENLLENDIIKTKWRYDGEFTLKTIEYTNKKENKDDYKVTMEITQKWPEEFPAYDVWVMTFKQPSVYSLYKMRIKKLDKRRITAFARKQIESLKDLDEELYEPKEEN